MYSFDTSEARTLPALRPDSGGSEPPLTPVRRQAALVRALLDEFERIAPHSANDALGEQIVDELGLLGQRISEVRAWISSRLGDD